MLEIREIKDTERLMMWRAEVIRNVFGKEPDEELLDANREYYRKHKADGFHMALEANLDSMDCGCGGVCFTEELPSPDNPSGLCGYIMNIYVREPFRKHGIAHGIVSRLIEESKKRGCGKIYLETTADGKTLYSSLGFKDMPDMMKYYEKDNKN